MGEISAQISVYPLRRPAIGQVIDVALRSLRTHSVEVMQGPMSTVIVGSEYHVFGALRSAFGAACEHGDAVLVATVSNACPVGWAHPTRRTDTGKPSDVRGGTT